jgi:hypothetical protein
VEAATIDHLMAWRDLAKANHIVIDIISIRGE